MSGQGRSVLYAAESIPAGRLIAAAVVVTKDTAARERVHARLAAVMNERFRRRLSPASARWSLARRSAGRSSIASAARRSAGARHRLSIVARRMRRDPQIKELNFDWNEPMKVVVSRSNRTRPTRSGLTSDNRRALAPGGSGRRHGHPGSRSHILGRCRRAVPESGADRPANRARPRNPARQRADPCRSAISPPSSTLTSSR